MGHPFSRHFLEQGMIFQTYESSSNYQQPFEIIHREFAYIKHLNKQIKPLQSVLWVVWYPKAIIMGLSCDITCSIKHAWFCAGMSNIASQFTALCSNLIPRPSLICLPWSQWPREADERDLGWLCRSSIFISGCVNQPNKEITFSKQRLLELTKFIERGIKNWPMSRTRYHSTLLCL